MKNYDENTKPSFLTYLDEKNLYGWAMSKKLPVDGFEWIEELYKFDGHFIEIMMKIAIRDILLK